MEPVQLVGAGIEPEDVVRVARGGTAVELHEAARERMAAGRAALDAALARGEAIYGASRGLGARSGEATAPEVGREAAVVRARAASVGPALPEEVVRAALCVRAATLATGAAGVSPAAVEGLLGLLQDGPLPEVPGIGSIGMSDLVLLATMAVPVAARVDLAAKDAIGLIGSNALTAGWAALLVADAAAVLERADAAAALSLEAYAGGLAPLDPRVVEARPAAGHEEAARRLRLLLAGSRLEQPGAARRLQDPLSFRCLAAVHGTARAALGAARDAVAIELRSSGDNPLVLPDDGVVLPTGNFHAGALALAVSGLALALHGVAAASAARVAHLLDERSSGLPRCLTAAPGSPAGLAPLQKTAAALVAEIRRLAEPAMLDAVNTAEGIEDLSAPALLTVRDTAALVERVRLVLAIELLCAAQGVELRGAVDGLGEGTARVLALVRTHVPPLVEDRPTGPDVQALAAALV